MGFCLFMYIGKQAQGKCICICICICLNIEREQNTCAGSTKAPPAYRSGQMDISPSSEWVTRCTGASGDTGLEEAFYSF